MFCGSVEAVELPVSLTCGRSFLHGGIKHGQPGSGASRQTLILINALVDAVPLIYLAPSLSLCR